MTKIKNAAEQSQTTIGKTRPLTIELPPLAGNVFLFRRAGLLLLLAKTFGLPILGVLVVIYSGCQTPALKANSSAAANNAPEDNRSSLEKDLQTMRDADFDFIYVFRRRDGNVLNSEDKKYLKSYSPAATNRFVLTDENKAVIAGSSFKFEPENIDNLQKRFAIENFSKPEGQPSPANANFGK